MVMSSVRSIGLSTNVDEYQNVGKDGVGKTP